MICRRHGAVAITEDHGWPLCSRCFREAIIEAEARAIEELMRLEAPRSVSDLIKRLEGRKR